jgi:hypothetical protein
MRLYFILLLGFLLAGCIDQQMVQVAKCQHEIQPVGYPFDMRGFNAELMDICMHVAGYQLDVNRRDCISKPGIPVQVNAYCYVPSDPIQYWLYRAELIFIQIRRGDAPTRCALVTTHCTSHTAASSMPIIPTAGLLVQILRKSRQSPRSEQCVRLLDGELTARSIWRLPRSANPLEQTNEALAVLKARGAVVLIV